MSINKFGYRLSNTNDTDLDQKMISELDNFLKSTGGTMTGALNMNKNRIMDLANPIDSLDAATKKYVDRVDTNIRLTQEAQDKSLGAFKKEIKLSDDYFRNEISKLKKFDHTDMKDKQIKNVAEPTEPNDVVTKSYLEKMNTFEQKEYKLKIPDYENTKITGELKLLSTENVNLFILVGKIDIISDVQTKLLNIAEMTQHFTDYQYLTRCVRYVQCDEPNTINKFLNQSIVDVLIKDNNIFLVSGIEQLKNKNCLEFNCIIHLSSRKIENKFIYSKVQAT